MSWSISCVENSLVVPQKLNKTLFKYLTSQDYYFYEDKVIDDEGQLQFDYDAMEHMDYLWDEKVQDILNKGLAIGDVCFGSLEGDNNGEFWGYRFDGYGKMTKLKGRIVWEEVNE